MGELITRREETKNAKQQSDTSPYRRRSRTHYSVRVATLRELLPKGTVQNRWEKRIALQYGNLTNTTSASSYTSTVINQVGSMYT